MKIGKTLANASLGVVGILFMCFSWGVWIGWLGFHLMTVLVMYGRHGVIGAVIGFSIPILSEIYTIAMVLWYQGFWNFYVCSFLIMLFVTMLPCTVIAVINMFVALFGNRDK